jgi:thiamine biosynthesis lipoprotein
MGLPITVEIVDGHDAEGAIKAVWAELRRIDRVYSPYRPLSVISRLSRGELERTAASAEVQTVLAECEAWQERTHGAFNMIRPDGALDPSGYVKGWAVYRAARILDKCHITRYCINAGGDMQLRGQAPDGGPWRIGLAHPFQPGHYAKVLALQDCAVATSGVYERGRHIYDPRTGTAVADPVSLTVVGATIDVADALATAALVLGETGLKVVQRYNCEALLIHADGKVVLTPGFRRFERL